MTLIVLSCLREKILKAYSDKIGCCDGDYVVKMKEDGNIIWMRKIAEWDCK
jgi:hypothetical protein